MAVVGVMLDDERMHLRAEVARLTLELRSARLDADAIGQAVEAAVLKAVGQLQLAAPAPAAADLDEDEGAELEDGAFWRNVLYADVVLPLVAVAIVLLILVAWLV